jgi:ribosomal protein S20
MSAEGIVLNAGSVAAISAIVSSVTAAVVRIVSVKGKYRAQAADVLVEAALHERKRREQREAENVTLRSALQTFINAVEYGASNGGLSRGAMIRLRKATEVGRRLLGGTETHDNEADDSGGEQGED